MTKMDLRRPTDAELEILNVLYERGACSVRDVHEEISKRKPTGYTTILKLMQIMAEKGLLVRDERERAHLYEVSMAQEEMQQRLVGDLLQRAFGGSASKLVMRALSAKKASPEEAAEIKALLEEMERSDEK